MKKMLLYIALVTGLAACGNKDKDPAPARKSPVVKFKVNGTAVELNQSSFYTYNAEKDKYGLDIWDIDLLTATPGPGNKQFTIVINGNDFTVGATHTVGGVGNDNALSYTTDFGSSAAIYDVNSVIHHSHGTFTLSEIKDGPGTLKYFYGIFSGTLYNVGGDSIVITEGQIIE